VGIGLLKEGDNAYCISDSRPFGAGFYERSCTCVYIYRRRKAEKVTIFFEKSGIFMEAAVSKQNPILLSQFIRTLTRDMEIGNLP